MASQLSLVEGDSDDQSDDIDLDPAALSGKRKRSVPVSCELCKHRKVKCDRAQPSCGWCTRNNARCEYKERKKPGLRAGYGRELENRLDKLEQVLKSHSEILANFDINNTPALARTKLSLSTDQGTPQDATGLPRSHDGAAAPLSKSSQFTSPQTGIPIESTPQTMGNVFQPAVPADGISPASHIPPTNQDYYAHTQPNLQSPAVPMPQSGPLAADQDMPPYDLLYALVDLYFKHIHTWCPILHRKTTLDALFGPSTMQETDRIILHAIVATTMRYSNDARLTEERRRHYHQVSKQRVLLYGMENSSVKALQALVILALDLCGSSNGPPGWSVLAILARAVVQLGLAVESNSFKVSPNYTSIYTLRAMILPEPVDFVEEESRRRLFWMVYLLDRYATIATAFEFALDDREIDRLLPVRDDLWIHNKKVHTRWFQTANPPEHGGDEINRPENLGAFGWYIECLGILSKIHMFLKQPVDIGALSDVEQWQLRYRDLDQALNTWNFSLPAELSMGKPHQPGSGKGLSCGWVMLHATYHTAVIRLHSSAAYPTTRSSIFTPSFSASQRCHSAVESIAEVCELVVSQSMLSKLGPPFAFSLWVAARLLLVHGSTVERKLSPQLGLFVDALRAMGAYWPVAARYCTLLERVLDEYRETEREGEGRTPRSVRILSDMRRTAFDLDFLISRQPARNTLGPNGAGNHNGTHPGAGDQNQDGITGIAGRLASVTPARTPQPNELAYLDVFDFFNVPRLPQFGFGVGSGQGAGTTGQTPGSGDQQGPGGAGEGMGLPNEYNITNFMVDASSDWLFQGDMAGGLR